MVYVYEYAGFKYEILKDDAAPRGLSVRPLDGQHPAARKEKHIRAARQCFIDDELDA